MTAVPSGALAPTIFHEPWWLDTVTQGAYREVRVVSGDRVVGRLPFIASRRFGMTLIEMPMLTHFLGPAVDAGEGSDPTRFLTRLSIMKALIRQLPAASHIYFKHHRGITETLAFQEMGFLSEVQFTREIAPSRKDELWHGMRDKTRNVIRRAKERFALVEMTEPPEFTNLYNANLSAKGLASFYDAAVCNALIRECRERGVGRVLGARDRDGCIKAAIFTVWDGGVEYYLMSTRTDAAGNGAISFLLWEAIKHASERALIFDFDGIRNAGDTRFFSGFGGTMSARFVSYTNSRAYKMMQRFWRARD